MPDWNYIDQNFPAIDDALIAPDLESLFGKAEVDYGKPKSRPSRIPGGGAMARNIGKTTQELGAVLTTLEEKASKANSRYTVEIGWFAGAHQYPESGADVAEVAAFQEFGGIARAPNWNDRKEADPTNETIRVPARSFLRPTMAANGRSYLREAGLGVLRALLFDKDPNAVMENVGKRVKADLQAAIAEGDFTPLHPITVARRKHLGGYVASPETPLIDTGLMIDSCEVRIG